MGWESLGLITTLFLCGLVTNQWEMFTIFKNSKHTFSSTNHVFFNNIIRIHLNYIIIMSTTFVRTKIYKNWEHPGFVFLDTYKIKEYLINLYKYKTSPLSPISKHNLAPQRGSYHNKRPDISKLAMINSLSRCSLLSLKIETGIGPRDGGHFRIAPLLLGRWSFESEQSVGLPQFRISSEIWSCW